ncbi:MAG: arginyltransferase, partial [Methylomonas sp.]|nr:arginyltransferase [Methylomonas sp.]
YKPFCDDCRACVPTRIPVYRFKTNRKQNRCLTKNARTTATIRPAEFDARHFDLYRRYQAARHDNESTTPISKEDYIAFLSSHWCNTWFVEFSTQGELMAIAVVDQLENALSAVYTFFEPAFADYSPGVYAVLWQIERAKQLHMAYVYLGFWIEDCRKMRYKIEYQPLEGLIGDQWRTLPEPT